MRTEGPIAAMHEQTSATAGPPPRDLGDFPTPPGLVAAILRRLGVGGRRWPRVLEPTCGAGRFLEGLLDLHDPPADIVGIEIQERHHAEASALAAGVAGGSASVLRADLFGLDLARDLRWSSTGPLLVVGNPPWVTSSALGVLGSGNHPTKRNREGVAGIAAITGASNFDLAEAVWIKLLTELAREAPTIALLGKVSVARRVLEHAARRGIPVSDAWLARIDARVWFNATVDAGLFCLTVAPPGSTPLLPQRIPIHADLTAEIPERAFGFIDGRLVADLDAYAPVAFADGACPVTWRQGVKHDAAAIMELRADADGAWRNGLGETVDIEPEHVYPLRKGTDLAAGVPVGRGVVVTQTKAGQDTSGLARSAPRLWAYLGRHAEAFGRRQSSVYRAAPAFAMFGIGPYSFAPYKTAVSGLHRSPVFRAVGPVAGRPVLFDDTCYVLPFGAAESAALAAAVLNGPIAGRLLSAITWGGKRPVTKAALQRIDLAACLEAGDVPATLARADADLERLEGRPGRWGDHPAAWLAPAAPVPTPES